LDLDPVAAEAPLEKLRLSCIVLQHENKVSCALKRGLGEELGAPQGMDRLPEHSDRDGQRAALGGLEPGIHERPASLDNWASVMPILMEILFGA
jgi:hypothetical protein